MRFRVQSLASLSGLRILLCHELRCRSQTGLLGSHVAVAVWLWYRPAAAAPIQPLAWEHPYAAGVAPEMAKRQKKKNSFILLKSPL